MAKQIVVLTGDMGSGKTTTCRQFAEHVSARGLDCAGIVCPARFAAGNKVGIDLLDLRTSECRSLAEVDDLPSPLRTGKYRFDLRTMAWGMVCLKAACPCDVLIVDELGPLELERGEGWVGAIDILRHGQFGLAVVVVRPRLVETFLAAMTNADAALLTLSKSSDGDLLDDLLALLP